MVDTPGNPTTTRTITVGGTVEDLLEAGGDTDWFRIDLTAGQAISVVVQGLTLDDPIVRIRNASGTVIYQNDDWGLGFDSFVAFAAPSTGTYYIDVGSAPNDQTGTYRINVTPYTPPPVGTIDDIARQLTHGYWYEDPHHFDVSGARSITVNLTGIDAQGLAVARQALALWTDIIGVAFIEVTTGGQIVFGQADEGTGAFSTSEWSNGITSSATVNVAPSRLSLHTYMHEIAHALGLGHSGDYNGGTAFSRFPYEAMWLNDGAAVSIMSYFDNGESGYYAGLGFTNNIVVTPQMADIIAMGNLYGLSTTTRTGDTTYGFNNNSGRDVFNSALNPAVSYTIFDNGGVDTLDYSGFANNQRIDLNAEAFSNVGTGVGNVSIARGTVIENAIGGNGNDVLIGNASGNSLSGGAGANLLTGGGGEDAFRGTTGNLNGDTIVDFAANDRIVFTNASLAGFTFSVAGSTLTYSGGSITLQGGFGGSLLASAAAGGGVQLAVANDVGYDFNGDGLSDALWRNTSGQLSNWLANPNGSFAANDANAFTSVAADWVVAGAGDFNGDGRDDILWRNGATGQVSNWLANTSGGFANNDSIALSIAPTSWTVVGTGDFNGDGRDDILWRNPATGQLSNWLAKSGGGFTANDPNALATVSTSWAIAGTGDFNGDGREDILWRNSGTGQLSNWLANANGGFVPNDGNAFANAPTSWSIVGVGDFNGDNREDILWRNGTTGQLSNWLANANGSFAANDANALANAPANWHIAALGDYNGDNRDDILWRSDAGQVSNWLATVAGGFTANDANALTNAPTNWLVQAPETLFV